ncbi:MAG: MBL fold metallo-hydrolase [Pseudomonadota bacterium]
MSELDYHFIRNATARLRYAGINFLLDPMLSNKGALPSFAGIAPNPTVDLPIPVSDILNGIEAVIISHMHGDHFDGEAAAVLDKGLPVFTPHNAAPPNPANPSETVLFKSNLLDHGFTDVREIGSDDFDYVLFEGVTIRQVFARHGKGKIGDMMGGVNGLIFEAENQPTIYWAGDTILDEGGEIEAILRRFKPDIVIAHTGGPVIEALSPEILLMDADQACETFRIASRENPNVQIVAIHMDALDHCFSTRADLRNTIGALDDDLRSRIFIPADGETLKLG